MKPNASILLIISAASLATVVGVTDAQIQQSASLSPNGTIATPSPVAIAPTTSSAQIQSSASPSPNEAIATPLPVAIAPTTPIAPLAQSAPASTGATRTVETCTVRMAVVKDPDAPLNVRSTPDRDVDNIIGQLKNGTYVTVTREQDGWLQINTPMKGWIAKNRTEVGCNQKVERIVFNGSTEPLRIGDRFIGTGNHRYVIPASKGQTLIVTRQQGPLPNVIAPNGSYLLEGARDEKLNQWSETLPETGNYVLELDSNFRGYKYTFGVAVKSPSAK